MKKWYDEEYVWEIEVIGFNKDNEETERFCRNGEEIGDKYTCTYGCPVNSQGLGICSKVMMMMYPIMEAVRSGGNLENIGGDSKFSKVIMCPDGCVLFRLTAKPLGNKNFFQGKFVFMCKIDFLCSAFFVSSISEKTVPIPAVPI